MSQLDGTNGEVYSGALYFPTSNLKYGGDASLSEYLIIVAWQIEFNGNVTVQNYTLLPGGGGPIHSADPGPVSETGESDGT